MSKFPMTLVSKQGKKVSVQDAYEENELRYGSGYRDPKPGELNEVRNETNQPEPANTQSSDQVALSFATAAEDGPDEDPAKLRKNRK